MYDNIAGGLTAAGLLMTSSPAVWFALVAAVGVWIVWGLSGVAARRTGRSRALIFVLAALAACGPALWNRCGVGRGVGTAPRERRA